MKAETPVVNFYLSDEKFEEIFSKMKNFEGHVLVGIRPTQEQSKKVHDWYFSLDLNSIQSVTLRESFVTYMQNVLYNRFVLK